MQRNRRAVTVQEAAPAIEDPDKEIIAPVQNLDVFVAHHDGEIAGRSGLERLDLAKGDGFPIHKPDHQALDAPAACIFQPALDERIPLLDRRNLDLPSLPRLGESVNLLPADLCGSPEGPDTGMIGLLPKVEKLVVGGVPSVSLRIKLMFLPLPCSKISLTFSIRNILPSAMFRSEQRQGFTQPARRRPSSIRLMPFRGGKSIAVISGQGRPLPARRA